MADDAEKSKSIQRLRKHLRFQPLRFVHIFFSIILTLYGTAIFLATLTVKSELSDYVEFLHYYLNKPVTILILGSVTLVCLGCLGIISSALNIYQGIITFGVLLFGLFMFKFTMGAIFLAVSNSADRSITEALKTHVNNYTENSEALDFIQINLNCCGISDFTDWNSTLGYIPGSCCGSDSPCGFADILSLNITGCYEALSDLIYFFINYLIMILGVLALLQVTVMIITFFLARGIADFRRRISESHGSDHNASDPETAKPQNPLGLKSILRVPHGGQESWNSRNGVNGHLAEKEFDHQAEHQVFPNAEENFVRNPIHNEDVFYSDNRNPRQNKIAPMMQGPRLPRAHRRFPIGL